MIWLKRAAPRSARRIEWLRLGLGAAAAILFILPLYWAGVASLRQPGLPPSSALEWWPPAPQWDNYAAIFRLLPFARYLLNSIIVVAVAVPLTLLTASQAGFAMAQLPTRSRRRAALFSVVMLLIPGYAIWLFRYQVLIWLGLIDSLWALIAPALAGSSPLFVLLFYWSFCNLPVEIFEAARLDGAGAFTTWRRVALPLARPTVVAVTLLAFMLYWSDFTSPVLYLFDTRLYTLAVGLQILKQYDATNIPLLMAAALLMTGPVVILFLALQRHVLKRV